MRPLILIIRENASIGGVGTITDELIVGLSALGWETCELNLEQDNFVQKIAMIIRAWRRKGIILASNNFSPAYAAWFIGKVTGLPWVMWMHGPILDVLQMADCSPRKRAWLQWLYRRVPAIVFSSWATQTSCEHFIDTVLEPQRQIRQVIHNVPGRFFAPRQENLPSTPAERGAMAELPPIRIGFVGRLSPEKQPLLLAGLMAALPHHYRLDVVGDGPLKHALQTQAASLIAEGRLNLHGSKTVTSEDYWQWQAIVLCSAYEGYPMTALESLASGVPIIASPIPPHVELLSGNAPYMLASDATAQGMATALQTTLSMDSQQVATDICHINARHQPEQFAQAWSQLLKRLGNRG